jgi:RHS repeat-associated protein
MKKQIYILTFLIVSVLKVCAQTTYTFNPSLTSPTGTIYGASNCYNDTDFCVNTTYGGSVKLYSFFSTSQPGNLIFAMRKCDLTPFSTGGTFYLKRDGVCGTVIGSSSISAGQTSDNSGVLYDLSNITSSTVFYGLYITSGGARYHTGPITITANTPPITVIPNYVSPSTGYPNSTNFYFSAGFSGGNGSATGIEIYFNRPNGTQYIATNQSGEVVFNSTYNKWELTKQMDFAGSYSYRYIIYQGSNSSASLWYDLIVLPPITIGSLSSSLNWNCTQNITWSSVAGTGNVSIELTDSNGNTVATLADGISNTGSFSWTVGKDKDNLPISNFLNGTYKIKMYPTGTTGLGGLSNSSFTVNTPSISLTSPPTQTYSVGQTIPIAWTSNNFCGNVSIELTDQNGTNPQAISGASNISNSGTYNYVVPNTLTAGTYKFKVYVFVGSGASPAVGLSNVVTIGTSGNCPSCITGQTLANFPSTGKEGLCAAQNLCSLNIIQSDQSANLPSNNILRGDLAKIAYLGLIGNNTTVTNAEYFDVLFVDLQKIYNTNTTYYKYAKVLSYLDYQDGRSPFSRDRANFLPNNSINRIDVLKVILEAWNIDENNYSSVVLPFNDVAGIPYLNYIKAAYQLGIISNQTSFFPNAPCTREQAFVMLNRLLNNTSVTKPTLTQINAGFFVPNTFRPDNLGVDVGTDRANFNHYTKTSFALDGIVPLVFAHSYNSYATEMPDELYPNYLGRGWTHSFNCYVTALGTGVNARIIVHYPDGTLHSYKANGGGYVAETIGVYDNMVLSTNPINNITITTPSKIVYYFEKMVGTTADFYLIKSIKDRNNNTLNFTNEIIVNGLPRLKSVADPAGRTLNFSYLSDENYLSQVSLSGVSPFDGRNIQFTYDNPPLDANDGFRNLASYKEPDLNGTLKTTTYSYDYTDDKLHLLKTITLPKGNVIDNTYQQRKLTSSRTMNGASVVQKMEVNLTPSYTSTSSSTSSVVKTTDENGLQKTTNYNHNTNGLPTQVTTTGAQPLDLGMTYGNTNDPTAVTNLSQNGTGVRIKYFNTSPYNVELIKTAKAVGDSITQSFTYNSFNDVVTSINGRGFTTTFDYNATGNLIKITDPLTKQTNIARNTNGLVQSVTTPTGIQTTFGYNSYGNLTSTSIANGANPAITTSATYDALSRLLTTTDPRSKQTSFQYFSNDLLKKTTAPLSVTTDYNYDNNDNLLSITNAKGNATTMNYDTQTDQLLSRSFAGKSETFTYYQDGSLKNYTNKKGSIFNFTYDASGRLTNDSYANYAYNPDGTINTISNSSNGRNHILDYDYDVLKRISKTNIDNKDVLYAYDNNNNLTTLTYPDGKTVTNTYDNNDRLTTVTDWLNRSTTYAYDDDGKLLNYTLPNGMKCIYTYDAAGRMTGMRNEKTGAVVLNSYNYVLDAAGNHLEENVIEPYSAAITLSAGTTNYTTDNGNQQTQAGTNTYGFDGNGAITNQAGQALTFDNKDNLLTGYGNSFYYDGNETRRAKTGKRFIINELTNSVIAETDDAGNYLYYYVYGPTGLLYRQSVGGTIEFYHYDFRGSTIATTNNSQTIVRQYQYDAFGKILQQNLTTDDNPFRYVGQHGVQYEQANLYFMRARYYDPNTGRFVSEDPIWATNLYPYAENNPVMMMDADGRLSILAATGIALKIAGVAGSWAVYKSYKLVENFVTLFADLVVYNSLPIMAMTTKDPYLKAAYWQQFEETNVVDLAMRTTEVGLDAYDFSLATDNTKGKWVTKVLGKGGLMGDNGIDMRTLNGRILKEYGSDLGDFIIDSIKEVVKQNKKPKDSNPNQQFIDLSKRLYETYKKGKK